jgi:hypothetical protein
MRATESKTKTPVMSETQAECFRLFVESCDRRCIPALYKHVSALGMNVSLRQLLRLVGPVSLDGAGKENGCRCRSEGRRDDY